MSSIYSNNQALKHFSEDIYLKFNQLDFQVRQGLSRAESSSANMCSDEDMADLRAILDDYYYLDDIGRIIDNEIVCTVKQARLNKPIPINGEPARSINGISYWNNQNKDFVEKSSHPMASIGNTITFPSASLISHLGEEHRSHDDSGGYIFLRGTDYILKIFGRLHSDQVDPFNHQLLKTSFIDWLNIQKSYITSNLCNDGYDLCLITISDTGSPFKVPTIQIIIAFVFSLLLTIIITNYRGNAYVFLKKLRQAINSDNIFPAYQPKINLATGRVVGVESLARWQDSVLGNIPPDIFISVAEEASLIEPLTEKFIQRVFKELKETLEQNSEFSVSINVTSDLIINDAFIEFLLSETAKYQFKNQQIVIEITERTTSNSEAMSKASQALKELGFHVSLDDFGTGFSNLSWLTTFEPNEIKIDKQFTQAIDADTINNITLNGMFSMLDHLAVDVVFEGIETEAHLKYIQQRVPDAIGQGWFFAKPMPIAELRSYLHKVFPYSKVHH